MKGNIVDTSAVPGFDVTAVIGHVSFDALANESAGEAAFRLIGRHDAEGVYTFPAPDGSRIVVTVEYERERRDDV